MGSLRKLLEDSCVEVKTKQMSVDSAALCGLLISIENNGEAEVEKFISSMEFVLKECFAYQVALRRIQSLNLQDKVSEHMALLAVLYEISNPGQVIIMLMSLLDFYDENNKKATTEDVIVQIFPNGFYADETCLYIIDNFIKTGSAKNAVIY